MIERWPLERLTDNPRNYRQHPEAQLLVLRASLRRHGQQKAVVVRSDGTILAGHGVVAAARAEGWTEVGVKVYDGSDADAYLVDDNETVRLAEDDERVLAQLLRERHELGTLDSSGWSEEVECD